MILAIDHTHEHNVIHRDVKPENIVFELSGYIRLADFGVAREYHYNNAKETSGMFLKINWFRYTRLHGTRNVIKSEL